MATVWSFETTFDKCEKLDYVLEEVIHRNLIKFRSIIYVIEANHSQTLKQLSDGAKCK